MYFSIQVGEGDQALRVHAEVDQATFMNTKLFDEMYVAPAMIGLRKQLESQEVPV